MPVPFWAGHYIGLPFQDHGRDRTGLDCWGLVRLVLSEQFAIALPSYAHEYERTTETGRISALIARESPLWTPVNAGEERLGDVIVLRLQGQPLHVGIILGDGQMLHIEWNINSVIERYRESRWSKRIAGFYRHRPPV